jgi:ribosomal protein S7
MITLSRNRKRSINKIIGDGKRFIAYDIIKRLEQKELKTHSMKKLEKAVSGTDKKRGKKHEVWEESF